MRVAALYDIHGNLPALEAVLRELETIKPDRIIIGGDVVPGPMPREVIARLMTLSIPTDFIHGNCELAVLDESSGHAAAVPESVRPIMQWAAGKLSPEEKELLATWPRTLLLEITGLGNVLFCHATPRDENEIFTRLTPEEHLVPIFADVNAPLVVCGHTHMQFDRMIKETRIVNAGSVGMPFGKPGADWLLLDSERGVELRHTDYDLAAAAARIRATDYIQAEDFTSHSVLNPPSESQMLELFTRHSVADTG